MTRKKKGWIEKLADNKDLPKTTVIPAPMEVDAMMRKVPKGKLVTINEILLQLLL